MNILTEKTWVPVGIAITALLGIGAAVGSATWFVAGMTGRLASQEVRTSLAEAHMNTLDAKLDSIVQSVGEINITLRERTADFVTNQKMRLWRKNLKRDNPALNITEWDE